MKQELTKYAIGKLHDMVSDAKHCTTDKNGVK